MMDETTAMSIQTAVQITLGMVMQGQVDRAERRVGVLPNTIKVSAYRYIHAAPGNFGVSITLEEPSA